MHKQATQTGVDVSLQRQHKGIFMRTAVDPAGQD